MSGNRDIRPSDGSSAVDLLGRIDAGLVTATETVREALHAISERGPEINAFITVDAEGAMSEAGRLDAGGASRSLPLRGLPIGIKDLQETAGLRTTYGSRRFQDNIPTLDCIAVERLRRAGAVVIGKTNTPMLGCLGETWNDLLPDCRNPWDLRLTAGGSSGGSSAALASRQVAAATGTDTAGSIACPASFCGIVGIKPTHGRLPTWPAQSDSGLIGDYGPMARSVVDVALLLDVLAGFDDRDPLSLQESPGSYSAAARSGRSARFPLRGMRVALSVDLGQFPVDADVALALEAAAEQLRTQGADVEEATPDLKDLISLYMPLYVADFLAAFGDQLDELREELPSDAAAEIDEFAPTSIEDYVALLRRLWVHRARMAAFFGTYDLLVTPATATRAFPLRQPPHAIGGKRVPANWLGFMPFQVPWNLAGQPTIAVPAAVAERELPVGLLLVAPFGSDERAVRAAAALEAATGT